MKSNSQKNKLYLGIIILIVVIFTLIGVIIKISNTNNKIDQQKQEQGQQLTETTSSNAYVDMATHLSEINAKQQELDNINNTAGKATVTASQILKDYTAYKDGKLITGTMANNGALSATLNAGASYTIPAGYTTGGKVTATDLASQTYGTATASNIASGKTAWVNGQLITGNASVYDSVPITYKINVYQNSEQWITVDCHLYYNSKEILHLNGWQMARSSDYGDAEKNESKSGSTTLTIK